MDYINGCRTAAFLVFDEFGFELLHRTFAGNTADCKTPPEMSQALLEVSTAEQLVAEQKPMVVVDGGLATKNNLSELRRLGIDYLANDKRVRLAQVVKLGLGRLIRGPDSAPVDSIQLTVTEADMMPPALPGFSSE